MIGDPRDLMDAVFVFVFMREFERAIDLGPRGEIEAPVMLAVDRLHMVADFEADDREIAAFAQQHAALGMLHDIEAEEFFVENGCEASRFLQVIVPCDSITGLLSGSTRCWAMVSGMAISFLRYLSIFWS